MGSAPRVSQMSVDISKTVKSALSEA